MAKKRRNKRKKQLRILPLLLIVILLGIGFVYFINDQKTNNDNNQDNSSNENITDDNDFENDNKDDKPVVNEESKQFNEVIQEAEFYLTSFDFNKAISILENNKVNFKDTNNLNNIQKLIDEVSVYNNLPIVDETSETNFKNGFNKVNNPLVKTSLMIVAPDTLKYEMITNKESIFIDTMSVHLFQLTINKENISDTKRKEIESNLGKIKEYHSYKLSIGKDVLNIITVVDDSNKTQVYEVTLIENNSGNEYKTIEEVKQSLDDAFGGF